MNRKKIQTPEQIRAAERLKWRNDRDQLACDIVNVLHGPEVDAAVKFDLVTKLCDLADKHGLIRLHDIKRAVSALKGDGIL